MARTFRCRECGETYEAATTTGPLPSICDPCDPEAAELRARARENGRAAARRRAGQLAVAEERIRLLEAQLGQRGIIFDGEPGREALKKAVVRVAHAEGSQGTVRALLELAAAAEAWAAVLTISPQRLANIEKGVDRTLAESTA